MKIIDFLDINPYIRYSHKFKITYEQYQYNLVAYEYRLILCYAGKGKIKIGKEFYPVNKGSLLLWQPGIPYTYIPDDQNESFKIYAINFDFTDTYSKKYPLPIIPHQIDKFNRDNIVEMVDFADLTEFNNVVYISNISQLEKDFEKINNEYLSHKVTAPLSCRGLLTLLLEKIAQSIMLGDSTDKRKKLIDNIIIYIQDHYTEDISNEQIGKEFNFHPSHINNFFLEYTKLSLHQYLIAYRLDMAINLLQTTSDPIYEIAKKTGFKDANYFSRCFKKHTGKTPKSYR